MNKEKSPLNPTCPSSNCLISLFLFTVNCWIICIQPPLLPSHIPLVFALNSTKTHLPKVTNDFHVANSTNLLIWLSCRHLISKTPQSPASPPTLLAAPSVSFLVLSHFPDLMCYPNPGLCPWSSFLLCLPAFFIWGLVGILNWIYPKLNPWYLSPKCNSHNLSHFG